MFKRRRSDAESSEDAATVDSADEATVDDADLGPPPDPKVDRSQGPFDVAEVPEDGVARIDFGSLAIPGVDGMDLSLEVDEQSQQVVAVTVIIREAAVQLQPFAAPRSGGFWPEVRNEMKSGITGSGGTVDEADGPFGVEIKAVIPAVAEDGQQVMQQARFVGVEGPRWLLRGVLLGTAATDPRAAEVLEDVFRGCVVTRGNQPMAPGELLALRLPPEAVAQDDAADAADGDVGDSESAARPPLDPFERGPEITEVR